MAGVLLVVTLTVGGVSVARGDTIKIGPGCTIGSVDGGNFDMMNVAVNGQLGPVSVPLDAGTYDVENFVFNVSRVGNGAGLVPFLSTYQFGTYSVIWVGQEVTGITASGVNTVTYASESFTLSAATTVYAGYSQEDFGYADPDTAPSGFLSGLVVGVNLETGLTSHYNAYNPAVTLPNEIHAAPALGPIAEFVGTSPIVRTPQFEINVSPVPEPATMLLLAIGGGLALIKRKRN